MVREIGERIVPAGQVLFAEGDPADALFVVLEGTIEIVSTADDESELVLATLGPGAMFGEQTLLRGSDARRSAGARAVPRTRLGEVRRATFERLLSLGAGDRGALASLGEEQLRRDARRKSGLIRLFAGEDEAPEDLVSFVTGEILVQQGEPADAVYLLVSGRVEVLRQGESGTEVLATRGAGDCIGELGVLAREARSATVVAVDPVEAIVIDAERFLRQYALSAELRARMGTLQRWYWLPGGLVEQFVSEEDQGGEVNTVYRLQGDRTLVAKRTPGEPGYRLSLSGEAEEPRRLAHRGPDGELRIELGLRGGANEDAAIVSLIAHGDFPETEPLHRRVLAGEPLTPEMQQAFAEGGRVDLRATGGAELLCRCMRVPPRAVVAAIRGGCDRLALLQEETGAGTVCGGCRFAMQALLDEDELEEPPAPAEPSPPVEAPADPLGGLVAVLRPVVLVATAPLLALLAATGVLAGPALAAVGAGLLGLLIWDLGHARARWRAIFHDALPDDRVLADSALRPPMLRRDPAAGPPSLTEASIGGMILRRLSLRDWLHYSYTLRIDYLLNDAWRGARHLLRRALIRRGVTAARRWTPWYRGHWQELDRQLGELVLETSLSIGVEAGEDVDGGGRQLRFSWNDWATAAGLGVPDERLHVEQLSVTVDLDGRRAVDATFNGAPIGVGADALVLAFNALVLFHHPVLHAYSNWACVPDHPDRELARAARYTLAMNAVSWHAGAVAATDARLFRAVLDDNAAKGIQGHARGALYEEVLQHSRTARFIAQARPITMAVLREFEVDIDPEAFFLMSVVHSVDHHACAGAVDGVDLVSPLLGYGGAQWIRALFVEPLVPWLADTRIKKSRSPWLKELHRRLTELDPGFADVVDSCIRY